MEEKLEPRCAGGKRTADKFLEACLLMLLSGGTGHGYALMEQLAQFGFSPEEFNMSTLYRTLRHMEKEGCLRSGWEDGGPGPRRRVYMISEKGKKELDLRIRMMKARKDRIDQLIGDYDRSREQAARYPGDTIRKEGA